MAGRQEITLTGGRPWGFSLMGGADHHSILRVGRVTPGSKSSAGGLKEGDVFISINGHACEGLKHVEAQQLVKNTGNELVLFIERGEAVKSLPASFVRVAPPPAAVSPKPLPPPKAAVVRAPPPASKPKPPPRVQEEKKETGGSSWYKQLMKTLKDQDEESDIYIPPAASMTPEASPRPNPPQSQQASIRKPPQVVQARVEHPPPKQEQASIFKPTPPPVYKVHRAPAPETFVIVEPTPPPPAEVEPTPPPPAEVQPTPPPPAEVQPTPPPPAKVQPPPPRQEPPEDIPAPPPKVEVELSPPEQEPPEDIPALPPKVEVELSPPEQEPPEDIPAPPPKVEIVPPSPIREPPTTQPNAPTVSDDNTVGPGTIFQRETKEVSPVVEEVEAGYKEALEKQKQEETKINELERQIAEDLLNLQETVQQAGAAQAEPVNETPAAAVVVQEPVTSVAEVKDQAAHTPHPIDTEPPSAAAVVVNPAAEEGKMEHFHPLILEEISKEAAKDAAPGRLEGDFSALEDLTAPGRHLPADAAIQTHREPEPEPEPEPAPVVVKKKHIPPPAEKARAIFDFTPNSERELAFSAGDIITLIRTVDDNWLEGTVDDKSGIVPINYVELVTDEPAVPPPSEFAENPPCVKALYRFVPESERELAFEEDDVISLTRVIDDNWFEGILNGKRGIVPSSFVEVLVPLPGMVVQPPEEAQNPSDLPPQQQEEVFGAETSLQSEDAVQEVVTGGGNEDGRTLTVEELQEALAGLTGEKHAVVFEYTPSTNDEIEILEGDTILVYEKCEDGWYLGVNERTKQFGTFPGNYVKAIV